MNPKVKLLLLLIVSSAMLLYPNPVLIIPVAVLSLALLHAKGHSGEFVIWIKPLFLVFLTVILLNTFTLGGLGFTLEGFYFGVIFSLRIFTLFTLVFLFVRTTPLGRLAEAFDFMPGSFSQILVLALSLMPRIADLTEKIMNAQKSRGLNFRSPNVTKTYFPILVPLFAKTLDHSERMALAMKARGFEG